MRTHGPPRLLLLDCDGVLIRSERANVAYYNHLFERFGLPRVGDEDREAVALLHTLATPQVVDAFFPASLRPSALEFSQQVDFARFLDRLDPEPGWREVLGRWRGTGRVAVATNRGASARVVLESVGILGLLDGLFTIRDVERPKPHPDLLFKALSAFAVAPEQALYVGDSELDREAARRAGVPFLGFRTPEPPSASSAGEVERFLTSLAGDPAFATLQTAGS